MRLTRGLTDRSDVYDSVGNDRLPWTLFSLSNKHKLLDRRLRVVVLGRRRRIAHLQPQTNSVKTLENGSFRLSDDDGLRDKEQRDHFYPRTSPVSQMPEKCNVLP
ncbi:hypothetical protein L596_006942 [Steinernema carpocapsae]|uniref:Uncharacterized protein n=1 Tax=Steinernema carpocapsae TaxID=34508 RepID=A0A4U5P8E9_STECR|nr:hypothetical protein L596_006942 [Steinernema carpocapsae]